MMSSKSSLISKIESSKRYWTPEKRTGYNMDLRCQEIWCNRRMTRISSPIIKIIEGKNSYAVPMKIEARTIVFKGTDQATYDKALKIRQELASQSRFFCR